MRKIFTLTFLFAITVLTVQAQTLFEETFEAGAAGWTTENIWMRGDVNTQASAYFNMGDHTIFMAANDDGAGVDAAGNNVDGSGRLISPAIDLTGATSPFLNFEAYFINGDYQNGDETAKVLVSKDNGATWDEVADLAGSNAGWTRESVDLTPYVGGSIMLAFAYADGGVWNYGFCVDNVTIFQPKANDIQMSFFNPNRFAMVNTNIPISIQITNVGSNAINSMEINWTDGTNTFTDMLNGLNIQPFETYSHTHSTSFAGGTEAKQYDLKAWTSNPNFQADGDPSNDELNRSVSFIINSPKRKVVTEEATGTWCPWCPRGAVFLEAMTDAYPDDFIGIAVHNNDPMVVAPYDAALGDFPGFPGYPSVIMNRNIVIDPEDIPTNMASQINRLTPLSVGGTANFDGNTRNLKINMTVETFTQINNGDLRVSAVIVEDGVTGTGAGYAQANNYAGGGNGPMGGYENLANPVPASQMVYDHVARALIGGWEGVSVLPATLNNGDVSGYSMDFQVPSSINEREMHVVVMVTDPVTSEVYNGATLNPTGIYPLFRAPVTRGCGPFEASFMDNSDSTTTWLWTFEGGTPATSTDQNPTVTYNTAGKYDVKLEVTTNTGNSYTVNQPDLITVDLQPTADFLYTIEDDKVKFDNESVNGVTYVWDFGDGTTSGTPNPTHVYAASGVYTVTLTTKNGTCESVITKEVIFIISGLEDLLQDDWNVAVSPNPFNDVLTLTYNLGTTKGQSELVVYNYMGQELYTQSLNNTTGTVELGGDLPQGIFFVQIRQDQNISNLVKVTKVK